MTKQFLLPIAKELVVDLFAGGGGWSTAFEQATGQHPHISINHDSDAISMHQANHPQSRHYQADVFEVCPYEAVGDMPVGWLHLSPDCTHHSQAKGGQPRDRKIRALSWVGLRWAGQVKPRIISLENVRQILNWGPLVAKRCVKTSRVMRIDGTVAPKGEQTPLSEQFLVPCKKRQGETWKRFVSLLSEMGYDVEWQRLVAADYGAPTTRDRLFLMARRDGAPIVWPEPTHYQKPKRGQLKWRAAAECIDWSIEGNSIFDRPRPLADEVMGLLAKTFTVFPAVPVYTEQSPAAAMTGWLADYVIPYPFSIDQDAELKARGESRASVKYANHNLDGDEQRKHIVDGKQCTRLALTWADKISFVLTDGLEIKRIAATDLAKEQLNTDQDSHDVFLAEFTLFTGEFNALLNDLTEALGGEKSVI